MDLKNNALFNGNQAIGMTIETRTDFPGSPIDGQFVYRSDELKMYMRRGSNWRVVADLAAADFRYGWMMPGVRTALSTALSSAQAYTITDAGDTLTANANYGFNANSVGGINDWATQNYILLTNEASPINNGWWRVATIGDGSTPFQLLRPFNLADAGRVVYPRTVTFSADGDNANTFWYLDQDASSIIGTNNLVFTQVPAGGAPATFEDDIGDGATTSFTLTHGLGTLYPFIVIQDIALGTRPDVPITVDDDDNVTLDFSALSTPTADQYHVAIAKLV